MPPSSGLLLVGDQCVSSLSHFDSGFCNFTQTHCVRLALPGGRHRGSLSPETPSSPRPFTPDALLDVLAHGVRSGPSIPIPVMVLRAFAQCQLLLLSSPSHSIIFSIKARARVCPSYPGSGSDLTGGSGHNKCSSLWMRVEDSFLFE